MKYKALTLILFYIFFVNSSFATDVGSEVDNEIVTRLVGDIINKNAAQSQSEGKVSTRGYWTRLYMYTLNIYTGSANYIGSSLLGYYTVSSARSELTGMGCGYWKQLSGSIIAPAWSNLLIDIYDCGTYWNSYAGVAYYSGYSSTEAIFWYQKVSY